MAEFGKFVVSYLLLGLVIFSFIGWAILFENENDFSVKLSDSDIFNSSYNSLNISLNDLKDNAEDNKKTFFEGEAEESDLGISIKQSYVVAREISTGFLTDIFSISYKLITKVLGLSALVYGVFVSIFIITFIILIYRWLRSGE